MGRTHKKITDWARQIIFQLRRWLPNRAVWSPTAVTLPSTRSPSVSPCPAPSPSSPDCAWMPRSMNPLHLDCQDRSGVRASKANGCPPSRNSPTNRQPSGTGAMVPWYDGTPRRVEIASHTAVWHHCGKAPVPIRWVLIRDLWGEFQPQALLCADLNVEPTRIIEWFMLRWQLEVTFQEVRTHLGVETQRQWSDRAIARTTPVLLGLFSWITVAAHLLQKQRPSKPRAAA